MVVGAFPAAKLGALLLKQISKPIANAVKQQAKSSPIFRKYVCMPPAQFYNWCEVKAKMWILNLGKPVNIPVLNEAMAIELGANLLGEGLIFLIAAGILVSEYSRSSRKEAAKEEAKKTEMERLQNTILELYLQTEQQEAQIKELARYIFELENRVVQKPWLGKKDKPDTPPPPPPDSSAILSIIEADISETGEDSDSKMDSKPKDPKSPPPPPEDNLIISEPPDNPAKNDENNSTLLKAVRELENDLWIDNSKSREDGIVTLALKYFYRDVYKVPLGF